MKRPWQVWSVFAGCLAIAVSVVAWLTWKAIELDRAEKLAHRQTLLEENARLALWRMEIAISPLVALESARPAFSFDPFIPTDRTADGQTAAASAGDAVRPSPLLLREPERTLLHFELDSQGQFTSPRVPQGAARDRALPRYLTAEQWQQGKERLDRLQGLTGLKPWLAALPQATVVTPDPSPPPVVLVESRPVLASSPFSQLTDREWQLQARRLNEFTARLQFALRTGAIMPRLNNELDWISSSELPVLMTPLCVEEHLFLARRVSRNGADVIQGCWLDWPAIRKQLLDVIRDLLPQANLQPVGSPTTEQFFLLGALPVWLDPGPPAAVAYVPSSMPISLVVAWCSLLLAAVAVAILLQGVISLSERRGAFVSAVTHELRTPLTTFRMYAEMLAGDMLPDAATRQRYLQTLCVEADRLAHLVENVLAYARLERGKPGERCSPVSVVQLLEHATERLHERARQAHLQFNMQLDEAVRTTEVLADVSAVEQILFNLVDNACKYAAAAADRDLHLEVTRNQNHVELRIRDHGPGIRAEDRQRLFQPFHKSARDAAHSAPGVGLGLSLCRRLARDMGGDLQFDPQVASGACFVLSLPVSPSKPPRRNAV